MSKEELCPWDAGFASDRWFEAIASSSALDGSTNARFAYVSHLASEATCFAGKKIGQHWGEGGIHYRDTELLLHRNSGGENSFFTLQIQLRSYQLHTSVERLPWWP